MLRIAGMCLLAAIEVVSFASSIRAPTGVCSFAEKQRNIELIRSSESGFDTAVDVDYPGVRNLDGFNRVRPFLAILKNKSGHGIKAYVVKWVVVGARGRHEEHALVPWADAGGREALTGEEIVWNPGEPRLISPIFNWGVSPFDNQMRASTISAMARGLFAIDSNSPVTVDISLDAVVYDDGVFSGPDKGNFYDRYKCERDGEQDEAESVLSWIEASLSDDDIVTRLTAEIDKGLAADGIDRDSLLNAARGREGTRLLKAFRSGGRTGLRNLSLRVISYKRTALRRL
jgi:hypothetical protein